MARGCADDTFPNFDFLKDWVVKPSTKHIDGHIMKRYRLHKINLALKKGYSSIPQQFSFDFLVKRLHDEWEELKSEVSDVSINKLNAELEIADMLNILEYIYRKIENDMTPYG